MTARASLHPSCSLQIAGGWMPWRHSPASVPAMREVSPFSILFLCIALLFVDDTCRSSAVPRPPSPPPPPASRTAHLTVPPLLPPLPPYQVSPSRESDADAVVCLCLCFTEHA
ncbi:hypothetical protein L226DRAFT_157996 [Lentinus tigrinus ALCF2SS1-7]|uniref:uncharacterized protein n=1 Tax=Lentinus tigrinus ALCF2SS1-7 TaxID=1328758 RepID=UPI0011660999|nr:hypothetical protein L226DRAFT_157996 [Lentinus tigrinus ALCF2SS1-7]